MSTGVTQMLRRCSEPGNVCRMAGTQQAPPSLVVPDDMTREQRSATPDPSLVTRVTAVIRRSVDIEVPDSKQDLFATGLVDSLSFVSLLLAMEEEFGIPIDIDGIELADFQSVDRIARFITVAMTRSTAVDCR